ARRSRPAGDVGHLRPRAAVRPAHADPRLVGRRPRSRRRLPEARRLRARRPARPGRDGHEADRARRRPTGLRGYEGVRGHPFGGDPVKFPPPVAELIGVEVEDIGAGESLMTMVAGERHSNPMGTIHGGILCDLADAAMGVAFFSTLDPGESFTTL